MRVVKNKFKTGWTSYRFGPYLNHQSKGPGLSLFIKNVSSSISHKKTLRLWNSETLKLWKSETPKLWNSETMKIRNSKLRDFFSQMSIKVILKFQNHLFLRYKTFQECQHYEDTIFSLKDIQGHMPKSFELISLWTNFDENFYECLKIFCYWEVLWFFTLRPSDLIKTLTNVLMDNFCPCFK